MKQQRHHRLPAGHKILLELDRNKKAKPTIEGKPKHDLAKDPHPYLNIGRRKSRKPVSLAKRT
jgi:hypothetical protein